MKLAQKWLEKFGGSENEEEGVNYQIAYAEKCVCDRCIGEKERDAILKNADRYLGSDHQAVLNNIKSVLMGSTYDERLVAAFEELGQLQEQKTRLNARFADVEDKLIKAGGPQVEQLQSEIEVLASQSPSAAVPGFTSENIHTLSNLTLLTNG